MMTLIPKLLLLTALLFQSAFVCADTSPIAISKLTNPQRSTGIQIGDVLKRSMILETATPQNIISKGLPAKGMRNDEVELIGSSIERLKEGSKNQYKIELVYQVFTNATKPKVFALPAQTINISNNEKLSLPAWHFWFSPLVQTSIINAKANVQPQVKAPSIEINQYAIGLKVFAGILIFSIIGLIYVNADLQWIPFYKGHFTKAHHQIKRLSKAKASDENRIKKALFNLHEALNKTYGSNLFADDINDFISKHSKYKFLDQQLAEFFSLSNQTLFTRQTQYDRGLLLKLLSLSKNLRNCERGV
jgi:mxaA protein